MKKKAPIVLDLMVFLVLWLLVDGSKLLLISLVLFRWLMYVFVVSVGKHLNKEFCEYYLLDVGRAMVLFAASLASIVVLLASG